MENTKATVSLFFELGREKNDNTYPVKLTVYFEGDKRRYRTGCDLTDLQWRKMNSCNLRDDDLKTIKRKLNARKEKAENIIDKISLFSFEEFEGLFFHEKKIRQSVDLKSLFEDYIEKLKGAGRIGTATLYQCASHSILDFKQNVKIKDITLKFLEEYELYLLGNGHRSR